MKIVVLFSGGLDSTTAAYRAARNGHSLVALSFDYGQRHKKRELNAAVKLGQRLGIQDHSILSLDTPRFPNNPLTSDAPMPMGRSAEEMAGGIAPTYVPGRNTLFLSHALSLAEVKGADAILIGANGSDRAGYPDCREEYFLAFQTMARLASGRADLEIWRPYVAWKKQFVVEEAVDLRVPIEETWSCYVGGERHCGRCDACLTRRSAFLQANLADPTDYAD